MNNLRNYFGSLRHFFEFVKTSLPVDLLLLSVACDGHNKLLSKPFITLVWLIKVFKLHTDFRHPKLLSIALLAIAKSGVK